MRQNRTRCFVGVACLCAGLAGHAVEPRLEWAFETKGKIYASPILADLDGDGVSEVIVCASRDKRVLCLDGQGELRWDYRLDGPDDDGLHATPSVIDYDGDGKKEVFFASHGGIVGCLDFQGRLIWRVFLGETIDYTGPVTADVDGDGRVEVIIGSDSGSVYCLDDCGQQLWRFQGPGQVRGIPAVARRYPERNMRVYVVFGDGLEACLSSEGTLLWSHMEPSARGERRSGPAVGDVDGDREPEVITATDDFQVIVRDAWTGEEGWRWAGHAATDQTNSFALAFFDRVDQLDIICADGTGQGGQGHVHRLRDGEALWTADVGGAVVQGPSIGDVDGDGKLEILVCSRSKRMICLSEDGHEEWSFPSATEVLTTPAIGDIDGDGKTEIVFTSKDRFVYCVTVDGAYDPQRVPWPMISHDPQLSGSYYGALMTPPAMAGRSPLPLLDLRDFGPIHAGTNTYEVQLTNNWYRPRHLEAILAVLLPNGATTARNGATITRNVNKRFEPLGTTMLKIEFPALWPGTYQMVASLLDVGQGRLLVDQQRSSDYDAEAALDRELTRTVHGGPGILEDMPPGPASIRIEQAFNQRKQAFEGALADMQAVVQGEDATTAERRDAVQRSLEAGDDMMRASARAHALRRTPGADLDFAVVPETALEKVFRDEMAVPPYIAGQLCTDPPSVSLCGNERESVQVVVVPVLRDLRNLRVSIAGDLERADADASIPAGNVAVHPVGFVEIGPSEYAWHIEKQGFYPDVLLPNAPMDVPAEQDAQPFFITVAADEDTPPGDYAGTIRFEADDCAPVELDLEVHVWDFHLSKETHLKTSFWMNEGYIQRFYGYESRTLFEVRKRFYQCHLEHRVSPVKDFPLGGGDMMEDFEYLMAHGQNCFFIALPGRLDEAGRPAFAEKLVRTRDLLEEKGWSEDALFYSLDEVAVMHRHLIPQMREVNTWAKTVIPEWPRLETSAPEQALFDVVDIWCPTTNTFDPLILRERMAKGERLWFYTVWGRPGIMIEFPPIDYRMMFWQCFKYGAEGFLYWGTTHWDLNCQGDERWPEKPWITYNRQPGHNGCGYLIYPGADGTPIPSIRLSLVRDGIEDYEYLYLLRGLLEAAGDQVPDELRSRAQYELIVPAEIMVDNKTYCELPDRLLEVRARMAQVIQELWDLVHGS